MKKILIGLSLFMACTAISYADVTVQRMDSHPAGTPIHAALSVYSTSITTSPAVSLGVQRYIVNNSTITVYRTNALYTVAVATTTGTPIYLHQTVIEANWFDAIYFAADPSAPSSCDVRVETQVYK
jgi:hypothetical protein